MSAFRSFSVFAAFVFRQRLIVHPEFVKYGSPPCIAASLFFAAVTLLSPRSIILTTRTSPWSYGLESIGLLVYGEYSLSLLPSGHT